AWTQTNHLAVWINANARWSSRRRALRRWDLLLGHFPNSIVPLANKPGPFLNRQVSCFVSKLERRFLIVVGCGGEQIDAIVFSCGQRDCLSMRHNRVWFSRCGEIETNSGKAN